ncbi:hypothetical protein GGR52DRAFT_588006 [Hypoxylon sp. FL1284]|nr:hypothetical protein GGR52DRAFT_588006 [Hypoxylon sp. FL1284]
MLVQYIHCVPGLKERLQISDNSWNMLEAYEDYRNGIIDKGQLGRKIRLSPRNHSSMSNTLLRCAQLINEKPQEGKHCMVIISAVGEILKIGDQPSKNLVFDFMKLPRELRFMCYDFYLESQVTSLVVALVGKGRRDTTDKCYCSYLKDREQADDGPTLEFCLGRASKQVHEEFMTNFYQRFTLSFPCACMMGYHIERKPLLMKTARHVKFHWVGPNANTAISLLHKMELHSLQINISWQTGVEITEREEEVRKYFGRKEHHLTHTLGIEELMSLRGIELVKVTHERVRTNDYRSVAKIHASAQGLEGLLQDKITRPRNESSAEKCSAEKCSAEESSWEESSLE